jgi:hypothetical protein
MGEDLTGTFVIVGRTDRHTAVVKAEGGDRNGRNCV